MDEQLKIVLARKRENMFRFLRLPQNTGDTINDCLNIGINGKLTSYLIDMEINNPDELIEFCKELKKCQDEEEEYDILKRDKFIVYANLKRTRKQINHWKSIMDKIQIYFLGNL